MKLGIALGRPHPDDFLDLPAAGDRPDYEPVRLPDHTIPPSEKSA